MMKTDYTSSSVRLAKGSPQPELISSSVISMANLPEMTKYFMPMFGIQNYVSVFRLGLKPGFIGQVLLK